MRVRKVAGTVSVYVSLAEVRDFASRWPCFGEERRFRFDFASNGDLVDYAPHPHNADDYGVMVLSQDAQDYAVKRGLLPPR